MSTITEQFNCTPGQVYKLKDTPDLNTLTVSLNTIVLVRGIEYTLLSDQKLQYIGNLSGEIIVSYEPMIQANLVDVPSRESAGTPPVPTGDRISVTPAKTSFKKINTVKQILKDIGISERSSEKINKIFKPSLSTPFIIEPIRPFVPSYRCEFTLGLVIPSNERKLNVPIIARPALRLAPDTFFNLLTGEYQQYPDPGDDIPEITSIPLSSDQLTLTAAQIIIEREIQVQIGTVTAPLSNIAFNTTQGIVTTFPPGDTAVVGSSGTFGLTPEGRVRTKTPESPRSYTPLPVIAPVSLMYEPDRCIQQYVTVPTDTVNGARDSIIYAQPGDIPYSLCDISDDVVDLYNTDWLAAISIAGGVVEGLSGVDITRYLTFKVYGRRNFAYVKTGYHTTFWNGLRDNDCLIFKEERRTDSYGGDLYGCYYFEYSCFTGEYRQIDPNDPQFAHINFDSIDIDYITDENIVQQVEGSAWWLAGGYGGSGPIIWEWGQV